MAQNDGMDTASTLLDLRSMARRLRVSMRWLRDEARAGRVPHLAAGRRLLFDAMTVEQVMTARARQYPDDRPPPDARG